MNVIRSDSLIAEIDNIGAELCKLYTSDGRRNLLWEKSNSVWSSVSPWLFPIVGKLKNDVFIHRGKEYNLEKHGFARKSCFAAEKLDRHSACFSLSESEETMRVYPFPFDLNITYSLDENKLNISACIENTSNLETLYFSIGAHPGFICGKGDLLQFEKQEKPNVYMLGQNFLLQPRENFSLMHDQFIEVQPMLFDKDAIIFSNIKSKFIELIRKEEGYRIRINFDSPYIAFWSKPDAQFVCVEPWYGIDDAVDRVDQLIEKKRGIQKLQPKSRFTFSYSIEYLEQ